MTQEESQQAPELETASTNPQPQQSMTDKFEMLVAKARKPVKQPIAHPFDGVDKFRHPLKASISLSQRIAFCTCFDGRYYGL